MAEPREYLTRSDALEAVFERSPDAFALFMLDGSVVRANAAARELFGGDEGLRAVVDRARDAFERAASLERGASEVEIACDEAPEPRRFAALTFFPIFNDGGTAGIAMTARDVSAARTAELRLHESQQRFRSLYEHEPDAVVQVDEDGMICTFNAATTSLVGFDLEEIVGRPADVLFAPEHRTAAAESIRRVLGGAPTSREATVLAKDGRRIEVAVHVIPIVIEGNFEGAHVIARDLTALKHAERLAVEQSARLRSLYLAAASGKTGEAQLQETLVLGLRLLNFDGAIVGEVDGDEMVVRFTSDERRWAIGRRSSIAGVYMRRVLEEDRVIGIPDIHSATWATPAELARQPQRTWRSLVGASVSVHGKPYGVVGFVSDTPREAIPQTDKDLVGMIGALCGTAIERMDHEQRLGSLAFFDSLTGLPNRVLLADRLNQTLIGSRRRKRQFALMYLDIDHFKRVNDEYGHVAGDQVLQVVAKRLSKALRESDTVARMSGDEFVIVQPAIRAPSDAFELARRVITELEAPIYLGSGTIEISASIGVAFFPEDATEAEDLIRRADSALYRAKAEGRGRASAYVPA